MTNTEEITFPTTIDYVPGELLQGTLRLTYDELALVVGAFNRARLAGARFLLSQVELDSDFADLSFVVAKGSEDRVATEIGPVVAEINAAG